MGLNSELHAMEEFKQLQQAGEFDWVKEVDDANYPPIKDQTFRAYIRGNGYIPQRAVGIISFVSQDMLQQPAQEWESFMKSEFSEPQVAKVSSFMSHAHASKDIAITTREHTQLFDASREVKVVPKEVLNQIWDSVKEYSSQLVLDYINDSDSENVRDINIALQSPEYSEKVQKLRTIVDLICNYFNSEEGILVASEYRQEFRKPLEQRSSKYSNEIWVAGKYSERALQGILQRAEAQGLDQVEVSKVWDILEGMG